MIDLTEKRKLAIEAKKMAHSPYSKFKVGVVLVTKNNKIYTGCNIENMGIMSICAERVAFSKAISEGEREFEYLLVVGDNEKTFPCGYCRQFISEFVEDDFKIYIGSEQKEDIEEFTLKDLLPYNFKIE